MGTFGLTLGLALCVCGAWGIKEQTDTTVPGSGRAGYRKHRLIGASNFLDTEKADLVDKHNGIRSEVEAAYMKYMEWDETLASKAKNIAKECKFENRSVIYPVNIYTGPKKDVETVIEAWRKQVGDNCEQPGDECSYQQITVPDSAKVGCAWKYCSGVNKTDPEYIVVCQYDIKFNKEKRIIEFGSPCSKCREEEPKCYNNLCMSINLCAEARFSNDCECKLECGEKSTLNKETCDCEEEMGELIEQSLDNNEEPKNVLDLLKQVPSTTVVSTMRGFGGPPTTMGPSSPAAMTTMGGTSTEVTPGESVGGGGVGRIFPTVSGILAGLSVWLLNVCTLSS